jgi:hypothetical protein
MAEATEEVYLVVQVETVETVVQAVELEMPHSITVAERLVKVFIRALVI